MTMNLLKRISLEVKRGVYNDKKVVVHNVSGKTENDIKSMIGNDKVKQVCRKNEQENKKEDAQDQR